LMILSHIFTGVVLFLLWLISSNIRTGWRSILCKRCCLGLLHEPHGVGTRLRFEFVQEFGKLTFTERARYFCKFFVICTVGRFRNVWIQFSEGLPRCFSGFEKTVVDKRMKLCSSSRYSFFLLLGLLFKRFGCRS